MPIIISGSNGISGVDGTAGAPAVQGSDGDTGVFFPAVNQIAMAANGAQVLLGTTTGVTVAGTLRAGGVASDIYPKVLGTSVAATSGTSIDFTSIPSWARRVLVLFNGVSTNGASNLLLQLGTSGGVENTGYIGGSFNTGVAANSAAGFDLTAQNIGTATWGGLITVNVFSGNVWCASGVISSSAGGYIGASGGVKSLAGVLDRVRITTVGGTDTFDAGSVNILWE